METDWEDKAEAMVADLRGVAASAARAALVVRFRLEDDAEADRLVFPNQHQCDPVEYLRAPVRTTVLVGVLAGVYAGLRSMVAGLGQIGN